MPYARYAVYYLPPEGALATFGAKWLGWDVQRGAEAGPFAVSGLAGATATPRKYGFHGTLKPPFRLAEGHDSDALQTAVAGLASRCAPARAAGLRLSRLGPFLALVPAGDASGIARIAAACVTELDGFRASPGADELARRRRAGLTPQQHALLMRWGYPYVLDAFRFHLTLTGRLPAEDIGYWEAAAQAHLPDLPMPFRLDDIALVGERPDGRFEMIARFALTG